MGKPKINQDLIHKVPQAELDQLNIIQLLHLLLICSSLSMQIAYLFRWFNPLVMLLFF